MNVAYSIDFDNIQATNELPLKPHHVEYLKERGIDPDYAANVGLRSVSAEEGAQRLGRDRPLPCAGLLIPYPDDGYARIRLDTPVDGARYLAPAGVEVPIYVPADIPTQDLEQRLYVVEAPIKALALTQHGFPAIGLGGTATTLTTKGGDRWLNGSWDKVALQGREVVVVFDAGRATNPSVARDEARLALALEKAGAKVRVAALPPKPNGKDQGPDDFLASQGPPALQAVINAAVPADPVERAASISAEHAVALLGDLPFLLSIKERGVVVEKTVEKRLHKHGIKATDLRRALREAEEKIRGQNGDAARGQTGSMYAVRDGRLCMVTLSSGAIEECQPLANFTAHIDRDELLDDGAERTRSFTISGMLVGGQPLPPVRVALSELSSDMWPRQHWGASVIVSAVQRAPAHLLAAIQQVSSPTQLHTVTHSGWREHNGEMIYLHADGAIGGADVSVRLDGGLSRYKLPAVAEDIPGAVKLSLSFLDLADPRTTVPLFCAVFRAPLQRALYCDATVALCGPTGSLKTTLSALAMGHFGDFDAEHLPASWSSTANSLERTLYLAADVLVAIDDFAPTRADSSDDLHRKAGQILRAIGNANSRSRLRADLTARPDRPPRALVLSTGEDVPSGESIQARLVTVRMNPGDVELAKLTELQKNRHRLPHTMLGYILWLKAQMKNLRLPLEKRFIELRAEMHQQGQHLRAPAAMAHLLLGMEYFCLFAKVQGRATEIVSVAGRIGLYASALRIQ